MFIGREDELEKIRGAFGKGKAILIYGRRRVGKTSLVLEASKDADLLMITCVDGTLKVNLSYIAAEVARFRGTARREYRDYMDMRDELAEVCRERPTVVAIDEYQYLLKADDSADSFMQHLIDRDLRGTGSTVILLGSSVSMLKSTAEDGSRPLYGRFRHIIHLRPLTFYQCIKFHPGLPKSDALRLYMTVGGIPRYHAEMDGDSYRGIIEDNCISDDWIAEEASFLMKADFPESAKYESMLAAVANGSRNLKAIAEYAGIKEPSCVGMVDKLESNGILTAENPMLGAPKRNQYVIADDLLAFRYQILTQRSSMLSPKDGAYDELYPFITTFLGDRFEIFCKDYVVRNYSTKEVGRWWMDDPKRDIHEEIDVVARISSRRSSVLLLGECKFKEEPMEMGQLNVLIRRAKMFQESNNIRLILFSIGGFEEKLMDYAREAGVMLVGPEELFGDRPAPQIPERFASAPHRPSGSASRCIPERSRNHHPWHTPHCRPGGWCSSRGPPLSPSPGRTWCTSRCVRPSCRCPRPRAARPWPLRA